jgi:hypothetical protein
MNKSTLTRLMNSYSYDYDNDGQIIFYSGWYIHDDRTLSKEPQEEI